MTGTRVARRREGPTASRALKDLMYLSMASRVSPEKRVLTWIRQRIHPYCWGHSDRFKGNFSQTTRRRVLDFFGCLPCVALATAPPSDEAIETLGHHAAGGDSSSYYP
jgi:hypothetical protein